MSDIITVTGASRTYRFEDRDVLALDAVDLAVPRGGLVALVGPSGSGKTTLLHAIAGFEQLDRGEVVWHDPVTDPRRWRQVSFLPQRLGLLDEHDLEANIRWPARLAGTDDTRQLRMVAELAAALGLEEVLRRQPSEASLGQQQRAALARALFLRPHVLLADEPTGHQDAASTEQVIAALEAACRDGTTAIVATHDSRVADRADHVIELHDGRIAARGGSDAP